MQECDTESAIDASRRDRELLGDFNLSFVYGEVNSFSSMRIILERVAAIRSIGPSSLFLDLGAGVGKAMLAIALLSPCSKILGIEYLETLVCKGNKMIEFSTREFPDLKLEERLQLIQGDFLAYPWEKEADFVFANSTW